MDFFEEIARDRTMSPLQRCGIATSCMYVAHLARGGSEVEARVREVARAVQSKRGGWQELCSDGQDVDFSLALVDTVSGHVRDRNVLAFLEELFGKDGAVHAAGIDGRAASLPRCMTAIEDLIETGSEVPERLYDMLSEMPSHARSESHLPEVVCTIAAGACGNGVQCFAAHPVGIGDFLAAALTGHPGARLAGARFPGERAVERDAEAVAAMRLTVAGSRIEFIAADELPSVVAGEVCACFFDFVHGAPRGVIEEADGARRETVWARASRALDVLPSGSAVVMLVADGVLYSSGYARHDRARAVERGVVEAVVALPSGVIHEMGIRSSLVVMRKGSHAVRLVDAGDKFVTVARTKFMDGGHAAEVLEMLEGRAGFDGDRVATVTADFIAEQAYTLDARALCAVYANSAAAREDGVTSLGDVCSKIQRGGPLDKRKIESLRSREHTRCRYLAMGGVQDGRISGDMLYIDDPGEKYARYLAYDGDVIVQKTGMIKAALARLADGESLLVNSNFFILDIDPEKAVPAYVAAYLACGDGGRILVGAGKGERTRHLSAEELASIPVPLPSRQEQERIARDFLALLDELDRLDARRAEVLRSQRELFSGG